MPILIFSPVQIIMTYPLFGMIANTAKMSTRQFYSSEQFQVHKLEKTRKLTKKIWLKLKKEW